MNRTRSNRARAALCRAVAIVGALAAAAGTQAGPPVGVSADGQTLALDAAAIRAAPSGASFAVKGVQIPGWGPVDLELERFRVVSADTKFVAGTAEGDREIAFDPESVVLIRGRVPGLAGSHVVMAITSSGTTGRIELGPGRPTHALASAPGVDVPGVERVQMRPMPMGAGAGPLTCSMAGAAEGTVEAVDGAPAGPAAPAHGGAAPAALDPVRGMKQVELAVDADHEYFLLMGDEQAALQYITMVYGFASDIMMRDLRARIDLVWVRIWMEPDPYGPTAGFPRVHPFAVGADQAQFFGAERLHYSGGVAYVCGNQSLVSHILGFTGDPLAPNVYNRDMKVIAHELGHTLGALHTHDYRLDECQLLRSPRRGTLMSYCFYSNGGQANLDLGYHVVPRARIADCMSMRAGWYAPDCNQNGVHDDEDIGSGVSEDANGNGIPDECEDCNGNGLLDDEDIASGASADVNENGVPDECEPDCNGNGVPDEMDLRVLTEYFFEDDFEIDRGWIPEDLGATGGHWDRGVPVGDPSWPRAPLFDGDGSGQCWLTGNAPGATGVQDGAVRLMSPRLDLTPGEMELRYLYYLNLERGGAEDAMLIEVSDDDGVKWFPVREHDSSSTFWRDDSITEAEIIAAGAAITDRMRMRFTVNDDAPQSIVEAGLDGVSLVRPVGPFSLDEQGNGVPDECEEDCDGDGRSDHLQIRDDMSLDVNRNAVLDMCEDCDADGTPDLVELNSAHSGWVMDGSDGALREFHPVTGVLMRESEPDLIEDPQDLITTPDRRILVSDAAADRIVEFDASAAYVRDLVAPGAGGLTDPGAMLLRGGALLVASAGTNSVLEFDLATGAPLGEFVAAGAGGLTEPYGMTFGPDGSLYVTSADNQVMQYHGVTGAFQRILVSAADNGGLTSPRDILFTPALTPPAPTPPAPARFLVASEFTSEILEFDPDTGAFRQVFNIGTQDGKLDRPWGMVIGRDGEIYLSARPNRESAGTPGGGGTAASHLTDPRIFQYQMRTGLLLRPYIQAPDSKLPDPVGFAFMPGDGLDCNFNQIPDGCDIASGFSLDANGNGVPDECESCPADCDTSGALDFADFLCFQSRFAAADPRADCDASAALDFLDFLCFQNTYAAGCP